MRGRRVVVGMVVTVVGVLGLLPANASAAGDLTCPVLTSVAGPAAPVHPGESLAVEAVASDDTAVTSVRTRWTKVDPLRLALTIDSPPGASGPVAAVVGTDWGDGDYALDRVELEDAAGNRSLYLRGQSWCFVADGRFVRGTHSLDWDTPRVVVSGATDRTPPVLRGLEVPRAVTLGRPAPVRWSIDDESTRLAVRAEWSSREATYDVAVSAPSAAPEASADLTLTQPGVVELQRVVLSDTVGNTTTYSRDGSVTYAATPTTAGTTLKGANPFDFAAFDVGVLPEAPNVSVRGVPGGLVLAGGDTWSRPVTLRITLQPGNIVHEVRTGSSGGTALTVSGLRNGTSYSYAATATNSLGTGPASTGTVVPRLSTNIAVLSDFTNDGKVDVMALRPWSPSSTDAVRVYPTDGRGRFRAPRTLVQGQGWQQIGPAHPGGSYPRSLGTLLRVDAGALSEENANVPPVTLGRSGWSALRSLDGGYDLNGDGTGDIIAVDAAGHLRVYARTSTGRLVRWPDIGTGWGSMLAVVSAGDLDGDRRNDVVAADAAGRLWLYPGTGHGRVSARRQIGSGWQGMGSIFAMRDFDGDRKVDIGAVTRDGRLLMYRGTGSGGLRAGVQVGSGWDMFF